MTQRLDQHGANIYSQFGEDGIISHIFATIGERSRFAVEFGAGDGESCSNTMRLWRNQGWKALLVEPDDVRFAALVDNVGTSDVICHHGFITPVGPDSIGALLADEGISAVDFMSIDVDGDDYAIMAALTLLPRVICIEFNPTIPPHLDVRQSREGEIFGASLLAMVRMGETLGYVFVGATVCNAFFVLAADAGDLREYETDLAVLCPPGLYSYAVTDYSGRITLIGQILPWGAREPYVLPLEANSYVSPVTDNADEIRRGFESQWGPAEWLSTPNALTPEGLKRMLAKRRFPVVCIDLTAVPDLTTVEWIQHGAAASNYRSVLAGRVLGLIRND